MGRQDTGARHHFNALTFSIEQLLKDRAKGGKYWSTMSWSCRGQHRGSISYELNLEEHNRYVRLFYTHTNYQGEEENVDYKIYIVGVPSNLGKGEVLYFLCPATGKKCRILYSVYQSKYFKSREAYEHRIYYTSQFYSKSDRVNNAFFEKEDEIEKLKGEIVKTHYRGKPTKKMERLNRMEWRKRELDLERMTNFGIRVDKLSRKYKF